MNQTIIIIPVYNNASLIRDVVGRISAVENADILFVDDGSEDDTFEQMKDFKGVRCIRHEEIQGYGSAVQSGLKYAGDMGYSTAVFIDPLCKKALDDIHLMLENLDYGYDMVSCSRILENYDHESIDREATSLVNELSQRIRELTSYDITDPFTGIRAMKLDSVMMMDLTDDTHGLLLQMLVQGAHFGLDIIEIPAASESLHFGEELSMYEDGLGMFLSLLETESYLYKKKSEPD